MSDSHGLKGYMVKIVELESPDLILHLGDNDRDCIDITEAYPTIPIRNVRGNCDLYTKNLDIDKFTLCGKLFYMTHGHLHGVKLDLRRVILAGQDCQADVLLFGHTHVPHYSIEDGMTVVNPGSILGYTSSYAILEVDDNNVSCELKTFEYPH